VRLYGRLAELTAAERDDWGDSLGNLFSARAIVGLSTKQLSRDKETPMSPQFRTWAAITGTAAIATLSLLIPTAANAAQLHSTPDRTSAATTVQRHDGVSTAGAVKASREWSLSAFGSGEMVIGCPSGYAVQFNAIGGPNFGNSNKAISATPVGYTGTSVTFWLTNWNPISRETTTVHIWCDPY
jgi:hypothetical protein